MPGIKVNPNADDDDVTEFIRKNFKKRECNRFRREMIQNETEFCECGYSEKEHSKEALQNKTDQSKRSTETSPTGNFGREDLVEGNEEAKSNYRRYIRLDCETDVNKILALFRMWKMAEPDVIFSVLSDSDCSTGTGNEVIESVLKGWFQNSKKLCSSLVEIATSTSAWIITGGLNRSVDQLIGNEVKKRLSNLDEVPKVVLGISNWRRHVEKKKPLNVSNGSNSRASGSNTTEICLSLNRYNTHFLLVDDGTQKDSGCERVLREMVELALTKTAINDEEKDQGTPLIYILIGGSVNAFGIVDRALANGIPVIIAMGTGGAADTISRAVDSTNGPTMEDLPEIVETLFHPLKDLLIANCTSADEVRQIIANITAMTSSKLEPFLEIVELLDKTRVSEGGAQKFREDIADLKKTTTDELLAGIKDLLISNQTSIDDSNCSTADAESDTVNHMRAVIEQMLVVNGIPRQKVKQAVDNLEPNVLTNVLTKVNRVFTNLENIRAHDQTDLLIKINIINEQKKAITSLIVETVKKVYWTNPLGVYALAADLDETFFQQLLQENWMGDKHESVLIKLLKKDKIKYVKLIIEQNRNSKWLTGPQGDLREEFRKNGYCAYFLDEINDLEENTVSRKNEKMLFLWCVQKQMPETAMLFWEQGQDCLAMALIAYHLSKKQKKDLNNKKTYAQMKFFSELALNFVNKCYEDNPKHTHDLLVGEVEDLGGLTPLQIVVDANFKRFIAVTPTDDLLNKIWFKDIYNYYGAYAQSLMLLLSALCPILAPVVLDIRIPADDSDDETQSIKPAQCRTCFQSYCSQVKSFLYTPLVNIYYDFISYIAYLTLFSIVMLTDFRAQMSPSEIALTVWTFILIVEEAKQVNVDHRAYKKSREIQLPTIYIIGFIVRIVYHADPTTCPHCLYVARIILAFSLWLFFLRTFSYLSILVDKLGPKIFMMARLAADLVSFLLMLAVLVSAYGVVSNVILYPNQPLNTTLLKDVFYDAWWSVLQQFNREDALGSNCNKNNASTKYTAEYCSNTSDDTIDYVRCKENRCPANNWIVSFLLVFHALIAVIMLLNVLIAMFNATFDEINVKQTNISKMLRYQYIREYSSYWMIPPPLCAIVYLYFIAKCLYNLCKCWCEDDEYSPHDNENKEFSLNGNNDFKWGERRSKSRLSRSPSIALAKYLNLAVREWEHAMIKEFYKENKGKTGWPVPRMESETYDNFHEIRWIRYILQQIQNKQLEEQSSEEIERVAGKHNALQLQPMQLLFEKGKEPDQEEP